MNEGMGGGQRRKEGFGSAGSCHIAEYGGTCV